MKRKSCILAAFMVVSTAMVAMAQERTVTPYASIRYFVGAYYQSKDFVGPPPSGASKKRYDVDLVNGLIPGTSRFGSRFASGNLTGQVELGLFGGHNGRVGVRQAWGAYKFDFGLQVLVGNTDAPWYKPIGAEAWDLLGGPGASQGDRAPRVRLSFMGAYIDLQRPPVLGSWDEFSGYTNMHYTGRDQIVPLATIGYEFKSDMADIGVGATGYKYFMRRGREGDAGATGAPVTGFGPEAANTTAPPWNLNHSLAAYMGFLNGHIKLGGPYAKFNLAYEKGPGLLGVSPTGGHFKASPPIKGKGNHSVWNDANGWSDAFFEGALELGYKTPDFGIGLAVGYMRNLDGKRPFVDDGSGNYIRDNSKPRAKGADRISYGINIDIPVAKGFRVVPTAYYLDERKDAAKVKQGADALAGIKLQLDL